MEDMAYFKSLPQKTPRVLIARTTFRNVGSFLPTNSA